MTRGMFAIVDDERYDALMKFSWRAVQAHSSWYAKTTITKGNKKIDLSMHRFIARTPFGMVCHHKNKNSLDNRFENLENMTKLDHKFLEKASRIRIKFEQTPTIQY